MTDFQVRLLALERRIVDLELRLGRLLGGILKRKADRRLSDLADSGPDPDRLIPGHGGSIGPWPWPWPGHWPGPGPWDGPGPWPWPGPWPDRWPAGPPAIFRVTLCGDPVAGATLTTRQDGREMAVTTTDDQGYAVFFDGPSDLEYTLHVEATDATHDPIAFVLGRREEPREIELEPDDPGLCGPVAIYTVLLCDEPVVGAIVETSHGGVVIDTKITNSQGKAFFRGGTVGEAYSVTVTYPETTSPSITYTFGSGETIVEINLIPDDPARCGPIVIYEVDVCSGLPLEGATVITSYLGTDVDTTTTDSNGRATFSGGVVGRAYSVRVVMGLNTGATATYTLGAGETLLLLNANFGSGQRCSSLCGGIFLYPPFRITDPAGVFTTPFNAFNIPISATRNGFAVTFTFEDTVAPGSVRCTLTSGSSETVTTTDIVCDPFRVTARFNGAVANLIYGSTPADIILESDG